jgi:hypothetical protein
MDRRGINSDAVSWMWRMRRSAEPVVIRRRPMLASKPWKISMSDSPGLEADISDIAVYDDRNILECRRTRRRERKPLGHKPVLNAPCVGRLIVRNDVLKHLDIWSDAFSLDRAARWRHLKVAQRGGGRPWLCLNVFRVLSSRRRHDAYRCTFQPGFYRRKQPGTECNIHAH